MKVVNHIFTSFASFFVADWYGYIGSFTEKLNLWSMKSIILQRNAIIIKTADSIFQDTIINSMWSIADRNFIHDIFSFISNSTRYYVPSTWQRIKNLISHWCVFVIFVIWPICIDQISNYNNEWNHKGDKLSVLLL